MKWYFIETIQIISLENLSSRDCELFNSKGKIAWHFHGLDDIHLMTLTQIELHLSPKINHKIKYSFEMPKPKYVFIFGVIEVQLLITSQYSIQIGR